jgi:hypothetical protein
MMTETELRIQANSPYNDGWTRQHYENELKNMTAQDNDAPPTPREVIAEVNPEAMFADGLDDAIIGYDAMGTVVYDYDKCTRIFVERDGMTNEEAFEFMEFNVVGSYVGDFTPVFVNTFKDLT